MKASTAPLDKTRPVIPLTQPVLDKDQAEKLRELLAEIADAKRKAGETDG